MQNEHAREDGFDPVAGASLENGTAASGDTLWTVEDVASYLKLQPETIRAMARRGELPAIKLGKVWRFQKTAILEMLARMGLVISSDLRPEQHTVMPTR
jgi:excisionase family DNA binding protein